MQFAERGSSSVNGLAWADVLAELERELGDSYEIRVDGRHPRGQLRYVATARRLGTHPYAVVTCDPSELRAALARPDMP